MTTRSLTEHARAASYHGDAHSARYVLLVYGDHKGWTFETRRARWDGAAALLGWWHTKEEIGKPPLDNLSEEDARDFMACLEQQGLARSTVRGYRSGARALTKALRGMRTLPVSFVPDYDPFASVHLVPVKKALPDIRREALGELASPLVRARLELLLALLALGMSVPEVCACRWRDVDLKGRSLLGYERRRVGLGIPAVRAFEQLLGAQARTDREGLGQVLGWNADTARRWLKRVTVPASPVSPAPVSCTREMFPLHLGHE